MILVQIELGLFWYKKNFKIFLKNFQQVQKIVHLVFYNTDINKRYKNNRTEEKESEQFASHE